jgi:hypothetical protein
MMKPAIIRSLLIFASCLSLMSFTKAQRSDFPAKDTSIEAPAKPYRILTSGKRITIQSKQTIKSVMVWTSTGHRIVEQTNVNDDSYTFTVSSNDRYYFLMLELQNGKRHTEKIGVN